MLCGIQWCEKLACVEKRLNSVRINRPTQYNTVYADISATMVLSPLTTLGQENEAHGKCYRSQLVICVRILVQQCFNLCAIWSRF